MCAGGSWGLVLLTMVLCELGVVSCGVILLRNNPSVGRAFEYNISRSNNDTYKQIEEFRKRHDDGLLSQVLPMLVTPFMIATILLPMMITSMKFMLLKGMILGKFAIIFGIITFMLNSRKRGGGLYSHNIDIEPHQDLPQAHYNSYAYAGHLHHPPISNYDVGEQFEAEYGTGSGPKK